MRAATNAELLSHDFLMALAIRVEGLGLSRVQTMRWLYETLFEYRGPLFASDGTLLIIRDKIFDDAYSEDSSYEWHSNVKRFAKNPPKRRPKSSLLLRFTLWDLAFKVSGNPIVLPTY